MKSKNSSQRAMSREQAFGVRSLPEPQGVTLTAIKEPFEVDTKVKGTELTEAQFMRFKKLCYQIKNNEHLAAILQTVPNLELRAKAYKQYAQFLTFKPVLYQDLKFY